MKPGGRPRPLTSPQASSRGTRSTRSSAALSIVFARIATVRLALGGVGSAQLDATGVGAVARSTLEAAAGTQRVYARLLAAVRRGQAKCML